MAFSKTPIGFFGNGYALASSEIKFPTSSAADISVADFTTDFATDNSLIFAAYHNLKVGDKVSLTTATTLPSPLATGTDYYVLTASGPSAVTHVITLSATKGGAEIALSDNGTGVHTLHALAPLQLVDDTEAHATTGDWRAIVNGIMELMYHKYTNTASADKSTAVVISKSVKISPAEPDTLVTTYAVVVKSQNIPGDVIAE